MASLEGSPDLRGQELTGHGKMAGLRETESSGVGERQVYRGP